MYKRFKDPTFQYGVTLAQTTGRAVLRLSDADALQFDFRELHKTVKGYIAELMSNVDRLREKTKIENELIAHKVYEYAVDPKEKLKTPTLSADVPYIDFSAILNALTNLETAAAHAELAKQTTDSQKLASINAKIFTAEQQLLNATGLPRRPWFKHSLYAPGFYTGYGVKTVPGVREAIEQKDWKEANEQIAAVAKALDQLSSYLVAL
jgi:N-acetylated-alpha-linked acidic dipeptidase